VYGHTDLRNLYLYVVRHYESTEYESTQYNCQLFSCFCYHVIKIIITSQQKEVSKLDAIKILNTLMKPLTSYNSVIPKSITVTSQLCQNCAFGKQFTPRHIIREDLCVYSIV
jgi:hypothetical protein